MRRTICLFTLLTCIMITLAPGLCEAADVRLEKDLQQSLFRSKALILTMERRLAAGEPVSDEFAQLHALGSSLQTMHHLLLEQFRKREGKVFSLGEKAASRHSAMMQRYLDAIEAYLRLLEALPDEALSLEDLRPLRMILEEILPERKAPLLGSLPYRHVDYPKQEPLSSPTITPAYRRGGNTAISPEDTKAAPEAPLSKEIAELAESLSWNPVNIYEWVKNTIETEWYWGCMKGAEETLRQRSGNDADQAALLVALLRASGFPTRYVRGVIEFFPDIEWAKHLTGIENERELAAFFQRAGIPYTTIIAGGRISAIRIEHIFVETFVPYANYRGAVIDEHGKVWLALDTSIKVLGYEENKPLPLPDDLPLAGIRDDYLEAVQALTPLDYTKQTINEFLKNNDPSITYEHLLRTRTLIPEHMKILPASLQFTVVAVTNEYTRIPDELLHKVRFTTSGTSSGATPFFDVTFPLYQVSNTPVSLVCEPETVEDQEIINSYGGLSNTPAYLVRLRPMLKVNGRRMAVGRDGLPMGADFTLTADCISPRGRERITNTHIMGNLAVMGIVAQNAIEPEEIPFEEKDAERLLFEEAINYIHRWNQAEEELSSLLRLSLSRPLPFLVTLGGVIDVTYLLDTPHGFDWKGVYVDADLRVIECGYGEPVTPEAIAQNKADRQKRTFMQLSALQGSVLEAAILEEDFQVASISTARLFGIASQGYEDQPPVPILTINTSNLNDHLPSLPFSQNLKDDIASAVSQGFIVQIPETEITYEDWTGIGYIKEDPETGEAGYMLSGMIAGAMTAWQRQRWPVYLGNKLEAPFSEPPTYDPKSALYIQKITATDLQKGIVGMECEDHLQVIVRDKDKQPVSGAEVIFTVRAGGGRLKRLDDFITGGASHISTKTDDRGIAQARLILGEHTAANPTMWWQEGYIFAQQVGENIIDASLETGASVTTPFTAFGHPRAPHHLVKTHGDQQWRDILRFAGFLAVMAEDEFGNPLSNLPIDFATTPAIPIEFSECGNPFAEPRPALLINPNDPCLAGIPLYGECETGSFTQQVTTDSEGASVHLIMGDVPYADYFVHATLADQNVSIKESFHLRTNIFGNCDGESPPSVRLMLTAVYPTDQYGNNINAGKIGGFLPLRAKIYLLYEGEMEQDGNIVGSREYFIKTNLEDEQVLFGDIPGIFEENGLYTVSYPLPEEAGVHAVPMSGFATVGGETIAAQGFELEVFSVDILTEPEVTVSVNDLGMVTCDCPVRYTIEPPEYAASTAYVVVYKDGVALVYLPTETKGEGVGTISRGFLLDPASAYEAQVVLNAGTGVEMKSEPIILNPQAIRITSLYLEDAHENYPVLPGEQATMKATTEPEGRPLVWSIEEKDEGVEAAIDPASGVIRADEKTESGFVTVRATDEEVPCIYKEAKVFIGCPVCASIQPGGGVIELSSIDVFISMGKAQGGYSAGDLFLRADRPSRLLADPVGLSFSSIAKEGVEVLYDEEGALCQVLAPGALADIRVTNEYSYDIRFFTPEEVTEKTDGRYGIDPSAEPFTVWRIENPDASPYTYNRLRISEIRNGTTIAHEYAWDESLQAWSLSRGNGLVVETRRQVHDPATNDRIIAHSIVDAGGVPASMVSTIYHEFPWGEEIIARVEDPNGMALVTAMSYYEDPNIEGSYGRLRSQVYPDGSWTRYDYDEQGRTILEKSPWLDSPIDAPADSARATYYAYAPVDPADSQSTEYKDSPRTKTETIMGIVASRTYYAYLTTPSGDRVEIVERCAHQEAAYGDPGNHRTVTTYNPSGTDDAGSGSVKSILYADGRLDAYTYEYGTFILDEDPGLSSFSPGAGTDIRETEVHGTQDHPAGIAYKTTRETSIRDALGNERMRETYVYTADGYIRIQWTVQYFDAFGHMTKAVHSNGTQSESTWGCCGKESDTDTRGIRRYYIYDDLQRLVTVIKEGTSTGEWPAQSDIYTTYTYDAMGRRLTETTSAGGLSLSTNNVYDASGRLIATIDQAGLVTSYGYDPSGLVTSVTRPGGATEVTTRHLDGQIKDITGTGVIPTYYEYGVNPDGTQWTRLLTGRVDSPRWEQTSTDMLGRTIRVERPGFQSATVEAEENVYDAKGRLLKTTTSGFADTLYEYDELGNQIRTGLDVNANGTLDLDANDRITESETYYALIGDDVWEETVQRVYANDFDADATVTGTQRTRLTGFGSSGNTEEVISVDIHGNQTITRVVIDPDNKTETRITDYPDSTTNEVSVSVNGLLVSSQSKTGVETTFGYDALGRRTGITDPRTGTTVTHYNNKGQVDYVEDPAGNRTRYAYDPVTGEKTAEIDALNKATRYAYNERGQITHTWGDVPYPVHYVYDSYGRMSEMYTYRNVTNWGSVSWPSESAGTGDVTRWHYDEATGLLAAKEDATAKSTTCTYTFGGKLATRTWARMDGDSPLVTAYSYSPDTGELLSIDYSDSTPDIAFTYDRIGRQKTITDAVGTRTFAYNSTLQLESETITGLYDKVIARTYENSGVPGRSSGFVLGSDDTTDYSVTYGYDDTGRHFQVGWDVGGNTDTATYSYLPDSDLLHQLTTGAGQKTIYSYEPHRDLRTQVKNEFTTQLISQYDYEYDPVGRRISVANSGQAFASVSNAFNLYQYNNRSELTESARYLGTDLSDTNNPVQSEYRAYTYDPIGNRTQITEAAETTSYTTNALNQYTEHTIPEGGINSFTYDDDGNLTRVTSDLKDILYTYNAENRLIAVEPQNPASGDRKVECIYDYMGRRVSKKIYIWDLNAWAVDAEIFFIYDDWNMISEIKNIEQTATKYYVWGLDLSGTLQGAGGIGGLLASTDPSSSTSYYLYDVNGNVAQLVEPSNGNISAHYEYDPFGNVIMLIGVTANDNPLRFSTKYFDSETEFYYYGYRYYSCKLERWINRDLIEENGGYNLYGFIDNNPINAVDYLGRTILSLEVMGTGESWFEKDFPGKWKRSLEEIYKNGLYRFECASP